MTHLRPARRAAVLSATGLLLALSLVPGVPTSAAAASDGLEVTTDATYTFLPDEGRIAVAIELAAKNLHPTRTSGGVVTRYFYREVRLGLQPEATRVRATSGGQRLSTTVDQRKGYGALTVHFPEKLFFGHAIDVHLTYDLPGGAPRSSSGIRAGKAFASFYAWASGDVASVRIVIPDSFETDLSGETMTEVSSAGQKVYRAEDITDTAKWYVVVDADSQTSLRNRVVSIRPNERLLIQAWPEDDDWLDRVQDRLKRGLPELDRLIGLPWPVGGQLRVSEVYTPLLEGYAGIYHGDAQGIEISEDLDDLTILHEASHAWFNGDLFDGRWINEGLANTYGTKALAQIGIHSPAAIAYPRTDQAAFALNDWPPLSRIDDDTTQAREDYGYETAFRVVSAMVTAAGDEAMRTVFAAAANHEIAYVGALPVEHRPGVSDWRVLLDYLQERAGVKVADYEFQTYVAAPRDVSLMQARTAAREAYAGFVADGDGWLAPYAVRAPMAAWDFDAATTAMATSRSILELRGQIAAAGRPLGLDVPAGLRAAYESAPVAAFPAVIADARADLAASQDLVAASARVHAPRDPLTVIGLIGVEPDAAFADALAAYRAERISEAHAQAGQALTWLDRAPEFGLRTVGGAIGAEIVIVGLLGIIVVVVRRSRRGASGTVVAPIVAATLPSQSSPVTPGADPGVESLVSEPTITPHDDSTA